MKVAERSGSQPVVLAGDHRRVGSRCLRRALGGGSRTASSRFFSTPGENQDAEADAAQEQSDAGHETEQRQLVSHVAGLQRRCERRLGDPDLAGAVVLRLAVDLDSLGGIVRALAVGRSRSAASAA